MADRDDVWEYFGEHDPYYGVFTVPGMRADSLDDDRLNEFFSSGEEYVTRVWDEIERHFIPAFKPVRSLDFGCGVGRLALPIAKRSGEAVGVDISTGMLDLAKQNADRLEIDNIEFIKGDDELSTVSGRFDFVHSFVVFQHINPKFGNRIFTRLVELLSDGGVGVLHVEYANSLSTPAQKLRFRLYRDVPFAYALRNLVLRKKSEPLIPMYLYDLNELMLILQQNDCHNCHIRFSKHGVDGVLLFFQKKKAESF